MEGRINHENTLLSTDCTWSKLLTNFKTTFIALTINWLKSW
jgi:hypothetical protein